MHHFQNGCHEYSLGRFNAYCKTTKVSKSLHNNSLAQINNLTMALVAVDVQYHTACSVVEVAQISEQIFNGSF